MRDLPKITPEQEAMISARRRKWLEISCRTGEADWALFESGAERCYKFANVPWPGQLVKVSSPLTLSLTAPTAAMFIYILTTPKYIDEINRSGGLKAFIGQEESAKEFFRTGMPYPKEITPTIIENFIQAFDEAVTPTVIKDTPGASAFTLVAAVRKCVADELQGEAAREISSTIFRVIRHDLWGRGYHISGQLWTNSWYWGGAFTSFFREVCNFPLEGDRAIAYEDTIKAAAWWYPHHNFVAVCNRPSVVKVEPLPGSARDEMRLHSMAGPALAWADGCALWAVHGVLVPPHVVDAPHTITVKEINAEQNMEVRRVMVEQYGYERYIKDSDMTLMDECPEDHPLVGLRTAKLYVGVGIVLLDMLNSAIEGYLDPKTGKPAQKRYIFAIDGAAYDGRAARDCLAAMASTFRYESDLTKLFFDTPEDYAPELET